MTIDDVNFKDVKTAFKDGQTIFFVTDNGLYQVSVDYVEEPKAPLKFTSKITKIE